MTHYLWHHENWTNFRWDTTQLLTPLGDCRLVQGKLLSTVESPHYFSQKNLRLKPDE